MRTPEEGPCPCEGTCTDACEGLDDHPLVFEGAGGGLQDGQEDLLEEHLRQREGRMGRIRPGSGERLRGSNIITSNIYLCLLIAIAISLYGKPVTKSRVVSWKPKCGLSGVFKQGCMWWLPVPLLETCEVTL